MEGMREAVFAWLDKSATGGKNVLMQRRKKLHLWIFFGIRNKRIVFLKCCQITIFNMVDQNNQRFLPKPSLKPQPALCNFLQISVSLFSLMLHDPFAFQAL